MFFQSLPSMLIGAAVVLLTITVHELAHGYAAYALGDMTAKNAGRLSLNPIVHIDPLGAILLFVVGFGWAKPVPVNPFFFKGDRRRGLMLVSFAGPCANLLLALLLSLCLPLIQSFGQFAVNLMVNAIYLNIYMAIFNLIPIPPLDGSKILAGVLPKNTAYKFLSVVDQYGMIILLILVVFNIIGKIVTPIAAVIFRAFLTLAIMLF